MSGRRAESDGDGASSGAEPSGRDPSAGAGPSGGGASAYREAGVDYETLDGAKRVALSAALSTSSFPMSRGARVEDGSRGEPATLVEVGGLRLGFVLECLGTKSMLASAYERETGRDRFSAIGYDTVAAVVNDCICVGALPFVVNAYFATGSAHWYEGSRHGSLVEGWKKACEDSGAAWGGGESPTLSGLVEADEIDLAGSAVGIVPEGSRPLLGEELSPGDEIVLVSSSGLHANGASLARKVVEGVPGGLCHELSSGEELGEALLRPSSVYVGLLERLLACPAGVPAGSVHYASHVTGHGLRKLMRADRELTYRLTDLLAVPDVVSFVAERAGLGEREAYGTLNMGVGFALFCAGGTGEAVVDLARSLGHEAVVGGVVEEGPRRVVLEPVSVTFETGELELR